MGSHPSIAGTAPEHGDSDRLRARVAELEAALAASEARVRELAGGACRPSEAPALGIWHIFDQSAVGMWIVSPQGTLLHCNPRFAELMGIDSEALVGRNVLSQELDGAVTPLLRRALAGARAVAELPRRSPGAARPTRCRHILQPILREGHLCCAFGLVEELGELAYAGGGEGEPHPQHLAFLSRAALEFLELPPDADLYQRIAELLAEAAPRATVVVNAHDAAQHSLQTRTVVGIPPGAQAMLRRFGREPIGVRYPVSAEALELMARARLVRVPGGLYELSFGTLPRFICRALERAAGLGEVYAMGFVHGGEVLGNVSLLMRRNMPLEHPALVETFINQAAVALQRRRTEEALRESEARYRLLAENVNDVIWTMDAECRFTYISPSVQRLLGRPATELLGGTVAQFLSAEATGAGEVMGRQAVASAAAGKADPGEMLLEAEAARADGSMVWIEARARALHDDQGRVIGFLGVTRDITERKRAEAERRELLERMLQVQKLESLGVLAGGIAHDFNNLLTGVLGNTGLALMQLPPDHPTRGILQRAEDASLRAADLARQMLAYSGKGCFIIEPIDLSQAVDEMAHLLERSISKKAVLRRRLAPDLPPVHGDATQLRQIIMNLIVNASEALGEETGAVEVETGTLWADHAYLADTYLYDKQAEGRYVYLQVSDSGCGMDAETQAKIFDPFFTTKFTGRGLGLAAVLGIVRAHHGAIRVRSRPAQGTTFRVLLPVGPEAPVPAGRPASAGSPQSSLPGVGR